MKRLAGLIGISLALIATATVFSSCGSSDDAKSGGTLKVIANGDVDYIDPGATYYQYAYMFMYAMHRPLFSWKPEDTLEPSPDLATGPAEISADGKKVTIEIRDDVKYSPPVDRVATSADVKYAVERASKPNVPNGYVNIYFADIEGFKEFQDGEAKQISGIETPSDTEIVFNLSRGTGATVAQALSLPISAPVPEEYARKFDAKNPSTYGKNQVATGPYMLENYQAGKSIELVRNPNWDKATDYRPAYLDQIEASAGNSLTVGSRQILTGESQVNGDFAVPPTAVLKQALTSYKDQVNQTPSGGNRYAALNTQIEPFNDINLRKAVLAASDREALRKTRGGEAIGKIATHFIPPGLPGFEEAGGDASPVDFLENPKGNPQLAAEYMKKAGFENGKYDGPEILVVADVEPPADKTAQVVTDQLEQLGFKVNLKLAPHDSSNARCGTPKAEVVVCPNFGWAKDFNDGQTILDPTFNGKSIVPSNSVNISQLDVPAINEAMDKAEVIVDPGDRAKAWGEIDKQVTAQAPAIPWVWDDNVNIRSKNVNGVVNKFNAQYDLSFTSLE